MKKCFVVMSFAEAYDSAYHLGIKPAVTAAGYQCFRMDEDPGPKNIPAQLVRELLDADLIIVDVSEPNPNVYYELGISHTLGNKTIVVTQNIEKLPFDLRGELAISYQPTRDGWALLQKRLGDAIRRLEGNGRQPTNMVQLAGKEYFDLRGKAEDAIARLNSERARIAAFREYLAQGRPITDNSAVVDELTVRILEVAGRSSVFVVSISGAAGLGKSYLAKLVAESLNLSQGDSVASVLPMDSFMMDRSERVLRRISGYDIAANNIERAREAIQRLSRGLEVTIQPYDHESGRHGPPCQVTPTRIVILDGIHSLHSFVMPYVGYGIFLSASAAEAKELRFVADVLDRCYVVRDAFAHADSEYRAFEEHVLSSQRLADAVILAEDYWKYRILSK